MSEVTPGVGVLCSGQGTNLQAILDAERRGELGPARVRVVIANVPGVPALARAAAVGVPAVVVDHRDYRDPGDHRDPPGDRAAFEQALLAVLTQHRVGIVALAGFMRLLGPTFLRAFPDRVLNIHPALLPAFPGLHAARQALFHGVRITGCTVHLVDEGCDTGPILLQAAVPVLPEDDEATLSARIQVQEHLLYPQALRLLAEGRVERHDRRTTIRDLPHPRQT